MNMAGRYFKYRWLVLSLAVLMGGCETIGRTDFERHSMSSLRALPDSNDDLLLFEAKISVQYPDSPSGDVKRMEWANDWMEVRGFCPDGFEVVSRRLYTRADNNPYMYDLRYELRCLPPPQ
jgi:hypothetical protein